MLVGTPAGMRALASAFSDAEYDDFWLRTLLHRADAYGYIWERWHAAHLHSCDVTLLFWPGSFEVYRAPIS